MGLRLLAHYYERNEALIVKGALDAAGIVVFIQNHDQIAIQPFYEIALGGYRLLVPEEELEDALSVIAEARRNRSFEGERLTQQTYIWLSLLLLFLAGLVLPLRTSRWHDVSVDPRFG